MGGEEKIFYKELLYYLNNSPRILAILKHYNMCLESVRATKRKPRKRLVMARYNARLQKKY